MIWRNTMEYALFLGCNIPARVKQYEISARAVLRELGVGVVDIKQFTCCGYPLRNENQQAFVLASAYNLALAEKQGLDVLALCKCGFGTMKEAQYLLREDSRLHEEINRRLKKQNLTYSNHTRVKHLLSVLYHDVGLDALKSSISHKFKGLKIGTHYGCHALRPSNITQFDDPVAPTLFDELVGVTGAKSIDWHLKLECCGAPLMGINDDLSMELTRKKLSNAKQSQAQFLCTACPYCQIQFDTVQQMIVSDNGDGGALGSILYPQLLGLCMGMDKETLGIPMNQIDINDIASFLTQE